MNSADKEITGNIGEWSEIYTLLKLLGEGKVYGGNENMDIIKNLVYPIVMIIRQEQEKVLNYKPFDANILIQTADGEEILRLPASDFLKEAEKLFEVLSNKPKSEKGSFPVARTQAFMDRIRCHSLKASSSDKTDIRIVLHNPKTCMNNDMGFSIKSQVGGDSTLLNASKATNFTYKVEGYSFSDEEMEQINAIDTRYKVIDRVDAIQRKGGRLVFDSVDNDVFKRNLRKLDGDLIPIIAQMMLEQFRTGEKTFEKLAAALSDTDPIGYGIGDSEDIYVYKLKHLLTSAALGMMPSKQWSGRYDANGGYLVVRKDGEVLCYHFYDKNRFEDFLFKNAYLERSKTRRHGYAALYRDDDGQVYFKLNLQVRLK